MAQLFLVLVTTTVVISFQLNLSRLVTKPTKWHGHPAKTQISLGIRPVWSESSLCNQWVAKEPSFLHADREDSDQTGWTHRPLCWFCHEVAHLCIQLNTESVIYTIKCNAYYFCRLPNNPSNKDVLLTPVRTALNTIQRLKTILSCSKDEPDDDLLKYFQVILQLS